MGRKALDLSKNQYGFLRPEEYQPQPDREGLWRCRCTACDGTISVTRRQLENGKTHCGCQDVRPNLERDYEVAERVKHGTSMSAIARELNLSRQRVYQIVQRAEAEGLV